MQFFLCQFNGKNLKHVDITGLLAEIIKEKAKKATKLCQKTYNI